MDVVKEFLPKALGSASQIGVESLGIPAIIAGTIISPIIEKVSEELLSKLLGNREKSRIELVLAATKNNIRAKLAEGKLCRNDDFYAMQENGSSSAEKILEATLLKCREEYENRKLNMYSYFFSNVSFDETVSYEEANSIISLFEQLSFQQVLILAYFARVDFVDMKLWDAKFQVDETAQKYYCFYSDCVSLSNMRLICYSEGGAKNGLSNEKISPLGRKMANLMEFSRIAQDEIAEIEKTILCLQQIVKNSCF